LPDTWGERGVIMSRRGEQVLACLDRRAVAVAFEQPLAGIEAGEVADGASELLEATDEEGNPDWERRAKGAELALDHLAGEGGCGLGLLPGVVVRLPLPGDEQPLGTASG
jgi:hypothetical protein